ncbi:MAG TPA: SDR family NAD(P)-dependent oxidoreductase [Bryobacteraceae bacterium]|nr:SDR family NAD(P)-dependent oxidoreductase [Bryobacteraceae bacterium]
MTLTGKVALITGSTRGIGWATARAFAKEGCTVLLNGRSSQEAVDSRVAEIKAEFGVPCIGFCSDVSDPAAVKSIYSAIFKEFKRLDVLVNNAGIMQDSMLGMIPEALIRKSLEVNVLGPLLHLQEAARLMGRNRSGSIINLSSIIGDKGKEGQVVYSTTKAAILGMTRSAAKDLAPKGIRVNAVTPGLIRTELLKDLPEQKLNEAIAGIKMGRAGEPEDVAGVILFLASDAASYVTGQVLGVDGGMIL